MKIIVSDFRVTGNEHLAVNIAILKSLTEKYKDGVHFFGAKSHIEAINENEPNLKIKWHPTSETYGKNRILTFILRELIFPYKYIKTIWYQKYLGGNTKYLTTTLSPINHPIKIIIDRLFRKKNDNVILHAELELLKHDTSLSISKIFMLIWKKLIKSSENGTNYIVLSPHIKDNLISIDKIFKSFSAGFHPFPESFISNLKNDCKNKKVRIGIPGLIKPETKGVNIIFNIEKSLIDLDLIDKIDLFLIGRASRGFKIPNESKVKAPFLEYKAPVDQKTFDNEIRNLDYILLPYPHDSYKLTASGAVFDAVKYKTPILGLKNSLFDYMHQNKFFPGELFDSEEELIEKVLKIAKEVDYNKNKHKILIYNLIKASNPKKFILDAKL